jgi:hypothetical protein
VEQEQILSVVEIKDTNSFLCEFELNVIESKFNSNSIIGLRFNFLKIGMQIGEKCIQCLLVNMLFEKIINTKI